MRMLLISLACLSPTFVNAQEATRPRAAGVESNALQEVGPWGAAALPEGLVPLSSDLWRGADAGTLSLLFPKISPDQGFPSLQTLVRQAIFSGGSAPTTDTDITRSRFEAANRFGPAEAAARLVFGVPRLASDVGLASIAIDAGLRVGRTEEACSLIEAVAAPPAGTAWLEARATCYALNDEPAAANLSVDLAKSRGLTDTWMGRAIAVVAGPVTAPPPFRVDSGRAIALSLRGKLKPPVTLANGQDPVAISALVGAPDFMASLPPEERLKLAQNGAARGVISVGTLARLQPVPDPAVSLLPIPAQITQKILTATSLSLRGVEARLGLADLKAVMATQPGLLTISDVPVLTEVALWAGDGALASSIADLAPDALDPRLALILALYDPSKADQIVERRIDKAASDPVARRLAMRDALVAWSAGLPVRGGLSQLIQIGLPGGPPSNAGLRAALDLAGNRGSKGEVILLSALALQGVEPAAIDFETLISAIKALRRTGLSDAARDLARDYLLATYVTLPARAPTRLRPQVAAQPTASPPAASPAMASPAMASPPPNANATPPAIKRAPATASPLRATPRPIAPAAPRPASNPASQAPRAKPSWGTP